MQGKCRQAGSLYSVDFVLLVLCLAGARSWQLTMTEDLQTVDVNARPANRCQVFLDFARSTSVVTASHGCWRLCCMLGKLLPWTNMAHNEARSGKREELSATGTVGDVEHRVGSSDGDRKCLVLL